MRYLSVSPDPHQLKDSLLIDLQADDELAEQAKGAADVERRQQAVRYLSVRTGLQQCKDPLLICCRPMMSWPSRLKVLLTLNAANRQSGISR